MSKRKTTKNIPITPPAEVQAAAQERLPGDERAALREAALELQLART